MLLYHKSVLWRIQNPAKYMRWSFLQWLLTIFAKNSILDVWYGSLNAPVPREMPRKVWFWSVRDRIFFKQRQKGNPWKKSLCFIEKKLTKMKWRTQKENNVVLVFQSLKGTCLRTYPVYSKAKNFRGMKLLRFRVWNVKLAKLKCRQKYFFSSSPKMKCVKQSFLTKTWN